MESRAEKRSRKEHPIVPGFIRRWWREQTEYWGMVKSVLQIFGEVPGEEGIDLMIKTVADYHSKNNRL